MGDVELSRRVASRADAVQSQETYSAAINMIQHPLPQASPNPRQRLAASGEEKQLKSSAPRAVTHPPTQLPSSLGSLKGPAERVLSCLPPAQAAAGGVPAPATPLRPVPTATYSFCATLLLPPKPLVALNELEQRHAQGLALHITQWHMTATDALTRKVPPTKHESQGLRGYASHEPKG